jgi:hypothetical protein
MYGGAAFDLETGKRAKVNHYGGFVCSYRCDREASLSLERSMPGHGSRQTSIGPSAAKSLRNNWQGDKP